MWKSLYSANTYLPIADEAFTPDLPGKLLAQGRSNKDFNVMVAHNSDEGLVFTSPQVDSSDIYDAFL